MTSKSITLAISDGIARLTLDRPDRGNPIDGDFCSELREVGNELAIRADVRAVLLRASGKFFSVGGDIELFSRNLDDLPRMILSWSADLHTGLARLARLDAPIVACVHATAMGGAVALIANCDLVFAARSARFGAGYPQIGYSCDAGASFGLASRMGLARARRFLLLNEQLGVEEAAEVGLVDYIVDDPDLVGRAEGAVGNFCRGPTRAFGEIRRLLPRALSQPFEAQLEDEARALARAASTLDAQEGIKAFLQKRPPKFVGH